MDVDNPPIIENETNEEQVTVKTEVSDSSAVAGTSEDPTNSSRLGPCEVCGYHKAKYTCPKCEVKTCSLKCNKIHKLEIECDGNRNRTAFITINKFTEFDLSNDYRLLEELSRSVEASKVKFGKRKHIPQWLFRLRYAAERRLTALKYLPDEFTRHKNNQTNYDSKLDKILWQIDWVFVNADLRFNEPKVDEDLRISAIMAKYLREQKSPYYQEKLQYYQSAGMSGINVYLKAEKKPGKKFYLLDPSKTLKECLRKKLIIECPTIHVTLKGHESLYNVIDTDDEDENRLVDDQGETGHKVVQQIINTSRDEDDLFHSLKNLLFISEYSDDEKDEDDDRDV